MNIQELNDINRRHMISETRTDLEFEWDDKDIMNIIMKQFKDVYPYSSDPEEFIKNNEYIGQINGLIRKFNRREISDENFLTNMDKVLKGILEKFDVLKYQYKYDINYYKKNVAIANRLLINGDGGIGKSYFLFKLEENLTNLSIPHLCIYCKYTKNIPEEIVQGISSMNNDFYLIIDAVNELEQSEQQIIIDAIEKILSNKNINIIISYRTKNLATEVKEKLEKLLKNTYTFSGVEYESSLIKVIETYGVESSKFIDILETNNPLYLKMLYKILDNTKIKKEEIGNLVQITFILETYIKSICGRECWENTKKIGEYMFENDITSINEDEISNILSSETEPYVKTMLENTLMDFYVYEGKKIYIFTIQRLSDFIIARSLNQRLTGLNDEQIIELINKKIDKMYSLSEAIIILIIDRYKNRDIEKALKIIFNSKLKDSFDLSTLRKIYFSEEQIGKTQEKLNVKELNNVFLELGGYCNRPFNCTNYITEQLIKSKSYINGVTVKFYESTYITKLKNMLYSIIFIEEDNEYIKEAFWYSLWLTSESNVRIRNLAIKVLFDIVDKFKNYAIILKEYYYKIDEFYIKKSIIRVLTSLNNIDKEIVVFLEEVLKEYNQIDSEIIYRISNCLEKDMQYIVLDKKNIYTELTENDVVDKELDLNHILFIADIYEKYLLRFERYNKENTLSIYDNFILNDKQEILKWNEELSNKFSCVYAEGYCKYSLGGERFKSRMRRFEEINIDESKMFIAFQKIFVEICEFYNYTYSKETEKFDEHINKFGNSILKKILLISQDILLGSLMCNYYTKEFSVLNDDKTFGYKVYEPFRFDEEELRICSPVSVYCEDIDKLNNEICKRLDLYGIRNENWFKDAQISIENIKKLCQPIVYQSDEWSLICADIHRYVSDNNSNHIYTETYDFNIVVDSEQMLMGDSKSSELTIECEDYIENLNEYKNKKYEKSTRVRNIESYSKDFKETYLRLPPTVLISDLGLEYSRKYSTWNDSEGNILIYCDNNSKDFYRTPITGAIYIKTKYLNKLLGKYNIKYWAYTEKNYLNKGWNEDASLHIELDDKGNIKALFKNNALTPNNTELNQNCANCPHGIYHDMNDTVEYLSLLDDLLY